MVSELEREQRKGEREGFGSMLYRPDSTVVEGKEHGTWAELVAFPTCAIAATCRAWLCHRLAAKKERKGKEGSVAS